MRAVAPGALRAIRFGWSGTGVSALPVALAIRDALRKIGAGLTAEMKRLLRRIADRPPAAFVGQLQQRFAAFCRELLRFRLEPPAFSPQHRRTSCRWLPFFDPAAPTAIERFFRAPLTSTRQAVARSQPPFCLRSRVSSAARVSCRSSSVASATPETACHCRLSGHIVSLMETFKSLFWKLGDLHRIGDNKQPGTANST